MMISIVDYLLNSWHKYIHNHQPWGTGSRAPWSLRVYTDLTVSINNYIYIQWAVLGRLALAVNTTMTVHISTCSCILSQFSFQVCYVCVEIYVISALFS